MTLTHLLVLLLVGAVVGLVAERLTNRALPYGWIGAIVAGLVGAWLMVDVLRLVIAPEVSVAGIPLISALIGAVIVLLVFSMVTGGSRFGSRSWGRR
ncbi:MAG: GlsB/YeaQ/YmgE family stress response membrane protein [Chloroflexi bacterium]|nr:MAG: GlsB/YeaQ/YmgE family stress response membrane protein [Chloroflexota bacterium]TMG36631.1 MAG: GlsB/YeaQ/YmgE family stress response membrane protein [Chloroflexota bacterium]